MKEGIVLGHKIYATGLEVDKSKISVIKTLMQPATMKGIRSFLGHAGFYRRFVSTPSRFDLIGGSEPDSEALPEFIYQTYFV